MPPSGPSSGWQAAAGRPAGAGLVSVERRAGDAPAGRTTSGTAPGAGLSRPRVTNPRRYASRPTPSTSALALRPWRAYHNQSPQAVQSQGCISFNDRYPLEGYRQLAGREEEIWAERKRRLAEAEARRRAARAAGDRECAAAAVNCPRAVARSRLERLGRRIGQRGDAIRAPTQGPRPGWAARCRPSASRDRPESDKSIYSSLHHRPAWRARSFFQPFGVVRMNLLSCRQIGS